MKNKYCLNLLPVIPILLLVAGFGVYSFFGHTSIPSTSNPGSNLELPNNSASTSTPTERFSARVDRVNVVFEQTDYTTYRLQTNDLVRTGGMNSERGYEEDLDATVYVLNWQEPVGRQIRYVRLTAEPNHLYYLDSENKIIKGSVLNKS